MRVAMTQTSEGWRGVLDGTIPLHTIWDSPEDMLNDLNDWTAFAGIAVMPV